MNLFFKILGATAIFIFTAGQIIKAEDKNATSSVSIPIRINLATIRDHINTRVPKRLATINQRQVCVQAKWLKTKIPVGIEVYDGYKTRTKYKWIKTKVTPQISCNISGYVDRTGPITLGGKGGQIDMSVPIYAQVTASKSGAQQTARASANIFATITPNISPDWKVTAVVSPNFTWTQRPVLKLFGIIKITIGSKVEPKLRQKMNEFVAEIPSILNKINIRSKVAKAWDRFQDPILISDNPKTYLTFRPTAVGYSGISIVNNILNAQISLSGLTKITAGGMPAARKVALLPLKKIAPSAGVFKINLPLSISLKELQKTINSKFPNGHVINIPDGNFKGTLKLKNISVAEKDEGKIRVTVDADYFGGLDASGTISFEGTPKIDPKQNIVFLENLQIESNSNNVIFDMLVSSSQLPLVHTFISDAVKYDYSADLTKGIAAVNRAMNLELSNGVKLSGTLSAAGASDLVVKNGGISLLAKANGKISLDVGL